MTVRSNLVKLDVREARANLRAVIEQVSDGSPVAVMAKSRRVAVLLRVAEADRWQRIEHNLAGFHGLELYPELAKHTADLATLVRGEITASEEAIRRLTRRRREILSAGPFIGLADVRLQFAKVLERAAKGSPVTIVSFGQPRAVLISYAEYDRLVALDRMVEWFASAGLDLAATDADVPAWVADFRTGRSRSADDAASA